MRSARRFIGRCSEIFSKALDCVVGRGYGVENYTATNDDEQGHFIVFGVYHSEQPSATAQYNQQHKSNGEDEDQWRALDFGDIEKSLASKLTDGHVMDILRCIDANGTGRNAILAINV